MTRRGSLVYYLASWICGGLFLTVAMYLQERASPEGMGIGPSGAGAAIITTYFLVLIFCAFLSLVFAFLLRLSMRWLHAESLWQWALAGDRSLFADDLGSALGVTRDGCRRTARRGAPDRSFTFSRRARHRRTPRAARLARGRAQCCGSVSNSPSLLAESRIVRRFQVAQASVCGVRDLGSNIAVLLQTNPTG